MASTEESAAGAGFGSLGLTDTLLSAVTSLGYEEPTPIQAEAIPLLLAGRDVLGQAATGTGKTAAFALPMLQRLSEASERRGATRGLVLVPTRELAMQVAEAVHKYAKGLGLTVVPVYGGAPMDQQIRSLRRGADVIVATPGRALEAPLEGRDRRGIGEPERPAGSRPARRPPPFPRRTRDSSAPVTRLNIGAGRKSGVRPGDLVGAIAGEAEIDARALGTIEIADRFSTIEVPEAIAEKVITSLRAGSIRGRKVPVRRDRPRTGAV